MEIYAKGQNCDSHKHHDLHILLHGKLKEGSWMYYYYPVYYYPPHPYPVRAYRQFPDVDAEFLHLAANETKKLMREASIVLDHFADSEEFDKKVMTAAQASNTEEVERLIKSIGITSEIDVSYNPDGLRMEFISNVEDTECCKLTVALRWR